MDKYKNLKREDYNLKRYWASLFLIFIMPFILYRIFPLAISLSILIGLYYLFTSVKVD